MRHPALTTAPRRGIALMEALIAVLLLSMAALAYAALQMRGLSGNASAMWRSKATLLANEMADRLRANPVGVADGKYASLSGAAADPGCGIQATCKTGDMASLDYFQWRTSLADGLPKGSGAVCLDSSPDDGDATDAACDGSGTVFAIKVFWSERGQASRLTVAVRP